MTPDPYRGSIDPATPQSWNRYPYVVNDPVNLNDPTGLLDWNMNDFLHDFNFCDGCPPILTSMTIAEWDDTHPNIFWGFPPFLGNGILPGENSTNWPDPYPIMQRIQDILSGNWGRTLGLDLSNCNPICDAVNVPPNYGPTSLNPQKTVDCINGFHRTAFGMKVQDLSYFSLTPANPNWKDNWWETVEIFSIKAPAAFLIRTASKSAATAGEWLYGVAAAGATLTDMTATATCDGSMIGPPTAPPGHPNF